MDRLSLYKESHHKELERSGILDESLNIPLSLISAILAVIFFFFTTYDYKLYGMHGQGCRFCFVGLMIGTTVFIFISGSYLTRSYNNGLRFKGYAYFYLDSLMHIDRYYRELIVFSPGK